MSNVHKCRSFLTTLIKLAAKDGPQVDNVIKIRKLKFNFNSWIVTGNTKKSKSFSPTINWW